MESFEIEKLPLITLMRLFERRTWSLPEQRSWWQLASAIDDALGEYGARIQEAHEEVQAFQEQLNAEIAAEPKPLDDDDNEIVLARRVNLENRNDRANRFAFDMNRRIKALDDAHGAELVTLYLNESVLRFTRKQWEKQGDIPGDRVSRKIYQKIDLALNPDEEKKRHKSNGKGRGTSPDQTVRYLAEHGDKVAKQAGV